MNKKKEEQMPNESTNWRMNEWIDEWPNEQTKEKEAGKSQTNDNNTIDFGAKTQTRACFILSLSAISISLLTRSHDRWLVDKTYRPLIFTTNKELNTFWHDW